MFLLNLLIWKQVKNENETFIHKTVKHHLLIIIKHRLLKHVFSVTVHNVHFFKNDMLVNKKLQCTMGDKLQQYRQRTITIRFQQCNMNI